MIFDMPRITVCLRHRLGIKMCIKPTFCDIACHKHNISNDELKQIGGLPFIQATGVYVSYVRNVNRDV